MTLTKRIGDIARVRGGKRLPKGMDVQDEVTQHPYLRVTDFSPGGIDRSDIKYIPPATHEKIRRYTISSDDVYVSIAGTIGRVGIVPEDLSGANLTENAAKITEIVDEVDKRYLMLFLRTPFGNALLQQKAGGTSQPKLALYRIEEIEFPYQPKPIQQRISDIAFAYDDLILNNRRRIELLEQSARLLFKEWFVHLRYPGHEHDKMVEGVPGGWERKTLGDVLILKRGYDLPEAKRIDGEVPIVSSSGITGFHNENKAEAPGIVTGRYGTLGEVFFVDQDYRPLNTALYVSDFKRNPPIFLVHFLKQALAKIQSDKAAVPGLNRNVLHAMKVLAPPTALREQFEEVAALNYRQIQILSRSNEKLCAARDLLLPRLMNGRLSI